MRVGLIARAEDRGLGIQTWEWARHMRPDRTLVVDMGALGGGFPMHLDRFPGAQVARWSGAGFLDRQTVRDFLADVDAVYTAETFYDLQMPAWADDAGVTMAVHLNPEFWKYSREHHAWPAMRWWAPTSWRLPTLPPSATVVPVPIPIDRWPTPAPLREDPVFVHVVGNRAAGDRNGTSLLLAAVQRVAAPFRLRLITQGERLPIPRVARGVEVELAVGGVADYWRLYDDADVLVMPRRYGGLCLPANEAAGAGLALAMTDCAPNQRWPIEPIAGEPQSSLSVPAGQIRLTAANVASMVEVLQRLARDHEHRHAAQRRAREWAEAMAWDELAPSIHEQLACG